MMENKQALTVSAENGTSYDRASEIKAFDDSKAGVKGLVDAGLEKIPQIFVVDESKVVFSGASQASPGQFQIPVIDIDVDSGPRHIRIIEEIRNASETWGFFQVVNHGVPKDVLDEMIEGVRRFNEQPKEEKMKYYSRDEKKKVRYNSNYLLHRTKAADWRDTIHFSLSPDAPEPEEFPGACREIVIKYSAYVERLALTLFELLSEALGLKASYLNDMECAKGHNLQSHYYPACPEPHRTFGTSAHKDPTFITVLLQDHVGGLQVLHQNQWVDVPSVPGAFIVNIGDLLQLISNGKFKSAIHRVLANKTGPRISVASFFSTQFLRNDRLYGPIKELLSDDNPPLYREIMLTEYASHFISIVAESRTTALDHFRL